jgi:hypothetical protein
VDGLSSGVLLESEDVQHAQLLIRATAAPVSAAVAHARELGTLFVDWRMPHAVCAEVLRRSD